MGLKIHHQVLETARALINRPLNLISGKDSYALRWHTPLSPTSETKPRAGESPGSEFRWKVPCSPNQSACGCHRMFWGWSVLGWRRQCNALLHAPSSVSLTGWLAHGSG
jgi:hypothetical protein